MIQQTTLDTEMIYGMNGVERMLKRVFDFTIALLGLVVLSWCHLDGYHQIFL